MSIPERLRSAGLRRTPTRVAVFTYIESLERPASHADLQSAPALGEIDDITLYRTLAALEGGGLVHRALGIDGTWRFSANPQGRQGCPGNHPHYLCTRCSAMWCLTDQRMPRVEAPPGATVEGRNFLAYGRCAACEGAAGAATTSGDSA